MKPNKTQWMLNLVCLSLMVTLLMPSLTLAQTSAERRQNKSAVRLPAPPPQSPTGATATAENVEFVGHIGGFTSAVAVQGDYAYIGEGSQLTILDISDPTAPSVVGKTAPIPKIIEDITVEGDYAYVAISYVYPDPGGGLRVVDVSDPAHPIVVGGYDTLRFAYEVTVSNNTAYVAAGDLFVVNVSDPAHPTEIGVYETPGFAKGVAISDNTAYVTDGKEGLQVVNVSDPTHPTEISAYETIWRAYKVAVSNDTAYIAGEYGLQIMDVSDSANPTELGFYQDTGTTNVYISDSTAYIAATNSGLHIVDVSNPISPTQISAYETPGFVESVTINDDYAYVADWGDGLQVINISNPTTPTAAGAYSTFSNGLGVAISNHTAYLAAGSDRLQAVDVSDPTQPAKIAACKTAHAQDIAISGNTAYVAAGDLRVVDVSVPISPTKIGIYEMPGEAMDVVVNGSTAYVAAETGSLRIVDVSDPANPTEAGVYDTSGNAVGVAISDNTAYVTTGDNGGLHVVDVSNPISPTKIVTYNISGEAHGIAVAPEGNTVYIAGGSSGLQVIDVSNPMTPTMLSTYDTPEEAHEVAVSGSTVYMVGKSGSLYVYDGWLRVIDVSDPANPTEIGAYDTPGEASNVAVSGDIIYVADGPEGLTLLRYTNGHTISGYVHNSSGSSIADVTISNSADSVAITDVNGHYTIANLITGTYTLTPTRSGWVFEPPTRTINVPPDQSGVDFTMLHPPVSTTLTLSGTINVPDSLTYVDTQGMTTTLEFPAGSVTQTTTIVLTPTTAQGTSKFVFAGHAFELEAYQGGVHQPNFTFNAPVTVTIHYSEQDVRGVSDEEQLTLRWWDNSAWQDAAETCDPPSLYSRDTVNDVISIPICHLSKFALFGPANRIFLPLVVKTS